MKTFEDFKEALTIGSKWAVHLGCNAHDFCEVELIEISTEKVIFKRIDNKIGWSILTKWTLLFTDIENMLLKINEDGGNKFYYRRTNKLLECYTKI